VVTGCASESALSASKHAIVEILTTTGSNDMDYTKMLFALQVRDLAVVRFNQKTSGMTPDQIEQYRRENMTKIIANIVDDIEAVAKCIDETKAQRETEESKRVFERLGETT